MEKYTSANKMDTQASNLVDTMRTSYLNPPIISKTMDYTMKESSIKPSPMPQSSIIHSQKVEELKNQIKSQKEILQIKEKDLEFLKTLSNELNFDGSYSARDIYKMNKVKITKMNENCASLQVRNELNQKNIQKAFLNIKKFEKSNDGHEKILFENKEYQHKLKSLKGVIERKLMENEKNILNR